MKKILKSLFIVAVLTVLVTGATRAVWSDQGKILGNHFTSGTADLKLWEEGENGWQDDLNTFTFNNIYPGWTEDFTFYMKNESASEITLDIVAKLSALSSDYGPLKDELMLKFWGEGKGWTGEYSLRAWFNGQAPLWSLAQNQERRYIARFRLNDVGNNFQGKDLTFTVLLTGTQQ